MPDPTQFDPDPIRVALDHGEVVELDGGTLVLDGEESSSVVLRLAPWRARSVARVLQEWSSVSQIFHHPTRPHPDELELSRTLELAAAALGDHDEPIMRSPRGSRIIPLGRSENRPGCNVTVLLVRAGPGGPRSSLLGHRAFAMRRHQRPRLTRESKIVVLDRAHLTLVSPGSTMS